MQFRLANIRLSQRRLPSFGCGLPCLRKDKTHPRSTALTGSVHIRSLSFRALPFRSLPFRALPFRALSWGFNPAPRSLGALSRRKRRGKPVSEKPPPPGKLEARARGRLHALKHVFLSFCTIILRMDSQNRRQEHRRMRLDDSRFGFRWPANLES